ncbi:MAG: RNA polymerase sigma factor [Actinobacteria bacterium]|nr:RNA polymerase sigma factor [Actinomycetota bacterium]
MDVPADVIESCKRGEPQGFEELIRLTHKDVYSLALRLTGNPDDAAEVSQETYMKLLRVIRSFRGDSKFSTWLYRVTSNVAISMLRKRSRHDRNVSLDAESWGDLPAPETADPELRVEGRLLKDRLDTALMGLPEGYRAVVVMKDIYGLSLAEAGKQLGITEGAAKVRLFRARQRLKEVLYEDEPAGHGRQRRKKEADDGLS